MRPPPIPPNEAERLAALYALRVLDTPPEERYDRITRLTRYLLDVPIALISLVDEDRQWFKSAQGYEAQESSREISFCAHAIIEPRTFVVPDASKDERFFDNPVVTTDLHVRFYAGHPLSAPDGSRIGTLCVVDREPRALDDKQLQVLRDLAGIVEDELSLVRMSELQREIEERRKTEQALAESENRFKVIFEAAPIGIAFVDSRRRITEVNLAWARDFDMPREELIGMQMSELTSPSDVTLDASQFSEMLAGRLERYTLTKRLVRGDDQEFTADLTVSLVRNALGQPHHTILILDPL